jgi:protein TonB
MQVKKSPKADLEKKRFLLTEIGLILALAICLFAFEWSTEDLSTTTLGELGASDLIEEEVDITQEEELPEPEHPEIEEQEPEQILEELVAVEDDVVVDDIKFDSESTDKTATSIQIITNTNVEIEEEYTEPVQFAIVEDKPGFPGGDEALIKFISEHTVYPPIAKDMGISGKVYVQFVIDVNGKVTQVKIAKSIDSALDAEAVRVVSQLPNWTPGRQRGRAVPVSYILPINFILN